ncbi:hypothetical protein VP1G_00081 [Cytospora mali]|uniref:Carcinoembryonic antigen-related cell adhesion molecule 1 n=1 Tax=Cytospora mali TaxID=578113 RepID=A0A194UME6_CYTMA|nr:hypothetical protein VP1G_00081 [Valsa mali var. pyri (nom. inval.)]
MGLNPDIANGTCYYAYNQAAGSELVPCGNSGIANVACCFGGDYCDSSSTCYDNDTGNSYLAGCTDPEYTDSSCPWKSDDFADQEWVGIIRCDAINKTANEWAWAGCSVPTSAYTSLERLGSCDCTSKATLFRDGQALLRHASVPKTVGGTISWVSGYEVTAAESTTAAVTTTKTTSGLTSSAITGLSAGTASSTGSVATSASATGGAVSTTGDGSLSAGVKAGIAVGSVGAALSVLAVAVMLFLHRRRRRGNSSGGEGGEVPPTASAGPGVGPYQSQVTVAQTLDGAGGMPPPAYSGFKTELPADESVMPKSLRTQSSHPGLTPEMSQSEFGDRPMSTVSELSSSPEMGERSRMGSPVYHTMASIAELQG